MSRILFICGLILTFTFFAPAQGEAVKKGKVSARTQFDASVKKAIDAASSSVGDDLNFTLAEDVRGEGLTIPKGAEILGRIVGVELVSKDTRISKVSVMFDFIQSGEDFLPCVAVIIAIDQPAEDVKIKRSESYEGSTVLSLVGKNLKIAKGKVFRIRLLKDLSPN